MILCDTGVYFEIFRDNEKVIEEVEKIGFGNLGLCDLSVGEIYFGMRKGKERKTKELINLFQNFTLQRKSLKPLLRSWLQYGRRIEIPDALIASFSKVNSLKLFTLNVKDFKEVEGLQLCKPN